MNKPSGKALRATLVAALSVMALALQPRAQVLAAESAPKPPGTGPRIGLALSGGGARGLAHIGVLKVLEDLRVPVHCVTGASIGAIVGGAYASGSPAARLETIVRATDWNQVFTDRPPRAEISSRRKQDDYKTLFAPEFGVKESGLVLPKGIIAGVSIEAFMRALTEPSSISTISRGCPSRSGRWPPTSKPGRRWCSTAATSPRRCARAWPSRA